MRKIEIKKGIYWVGGIDWNLRSFHGYLTPKGSSYNAYLVVDEKIVLVDTVKHYLFDEMYGRIASLIDPAKIDYIICNHVEMDHSGSLPDLLKICKKAEIIASQNGEKGLLMHYDLDRPVHIVNTGDTVKIGKRSLAFVTMPMVHWPDSMATYIPEEKLLLPNDAFGQHIASCERFDDECEWAIIQREAAKYYANIVLPYGAQVRKALEAVSNLDVEMIAPSHGLIWRTHVKDIVRSYREWAEGRQANKAVIAYDTMWGSTEKIAKAIYDVFEKKGMSASLLNLSGTHISDVMTEVLEAKYICVGSPTLNNGMLPTVAAFLTYMKGLSPRNKTGLAFGSYGWGGQSVDQIENILKETGFTLFEKIKAQYIPKENIISEIFEKLERSLL
ncbi:MAG: FprA family A-type flavoprotein [Candidatus Omnitrophica bacterium]|nr:FprA family A-type flavoprotein [Candidatus Omnitrophota bacterium]